MKLIERRPSKLLADYVKCYWILEAENIIHEELVYPTGEAQMMFHYREPFLSTDSKGISEAQPRVFVSGLYTSYQLVEVGKSCGVIGVCFHPYSLKMFLPISLKEIANLNLPLSELSSKFRYLEYQIADCKNNDERICLIENLLLSCLIEKKQHPYPVIKNVVSSIQNAKGLLKTENIIKNVPYSERQFERIFNSYTGISPYKFIELHKFHHSVKLLDKPLALTAVAYESGFYDQSHFIKTFKKFTGLTPGEYRNQYCISKSLR